MSLTGNRRRKGCMEALTPIVCNPWSSIKPLTFTRFSFSSQSHCNYSSWILKKKRGLKLSIHTEALRFVYSSTRLTGIYPLKTERGKNWYGNLKKRNFSKCWFIPPPSSCKIHNLQSPWFPSIKIALGICEEQYSVLLWPWGEVKPAAPQTHRSGQSPSDIHALCGKH